MIFCIFVITLLAANFTIGMSTNDLTTDKCCKLRRAVDTDNSDMIVDLLKKGMHPLAKDKVTGLTPLHMAAKSVKLNVLRSLIAFMPKDGSIDQRDNCEYTALEIIVCGNTNAHVASASVLISAGANINQRNKNGYTPLHVACINAASKIITLLLAHGAKVNVCTTKTKETPLHMIAQSFTQDCSTSIEELIKAGALVNVGDKDGLTPLHNAARFDNLEAVKILIKMGANINVLTDNALSPWNIAYNRRQNAIVQELENAGAKKVIFCEEKFENK